MMPTCLPELIYKIHRNPHYGGSQNLEHPPSICFSYCYIPCHITSLRYASRNAEIHDTFDCYSKKLFSIVPSKLRKDCKNNLIHLKIYIFYAFFYYCPIACLVLLFLLLCLLNSQHFVSFRFESVYI